MTTQKRFKIYDLGFKRYKFFFISLLVYLSIGLFMPLAFADVSSGPTTTVAVPPRSDNYQLSLSQDVGKGPISQGTDVIYTVVYGAKASSVFTTDDTLTVNFSQNTLDGITPIADYVLNSATNAYNGAPPIVDLVNKTITWHISQMPADTTDQIVTFKFKTNSNYTGSTWIPITITADMSNQYMTMPQVSDTTLYGFHIYEPSTTTAPTSTPTPAPPVTPTPPITPFIISNIDFTQITPTEATIHIDTTQKTRLSALYGVSPNALFQTFSDTNLASSHNVTLTKLTPQTTYFLKLIVTDENGISSHSDILTFTTAKSESPIHVEQQSVILISGSNPLISTNPLLPYAQVLIPHTKNYTIGLRVTKPENITSIVALVEDAHVLGVNTFTPLTNTNAWSAPMIEQQPGVYIAQLTAPTTPNTYDVFAKIRDNSGNITQTKIAEAIVYNSIQVVDAATKNGVEHARIFLSVYDKTKNDYEPILSSQIQENPIFTDKNGLALITNGGGTYKVSVSQYGYRTKEVVFTIDKNHLYPPTIPIVHEGFTLLNIAQYYGNTASDFFQNIIASLQGVSDSFRFFKLISILVLLSLIIVTFMLFLIRTRLSIFVVPIFIRNHIQRTGFVHGQVLDAITHQPITQAVVAMSNRDSHEVLNTTLTNKNGIFYLDSRWANSNNIINILAQGYRTNKFAVNRDLFPATFSLHHNLVGGPLHNPIVASILHVISLFFEATLVVSLILELFFISTVGIWGFVFVGLSLFTLLLWILYQRENKI